MGILKEQLCVNQTGKEITSQFTIENDYNVPDNKADIGRIITGEGYIKIEEIKPVESYLKICGTLYFKLLYVTDSAIPSLASMEGHLPMEEMVYVENDDLEEYLVKIKRLHLMTNLIHSRKIEVKAIAEMSLHWERSKITEVALGVESVIPVFQKIQSAEIMELHDNKRDIYRIKEEITLPGTKENIEKIIWQEINLRKLDTKLQPDMLTLNGELQVFCIYQSQEEKIDWVEQSLPFEGQIACNGVDASFYHHVDQNLSDSSMEIRLDEDGEMRVLGVDATLEMRIHIYKEETKDLLEDVYSLEQECDTVSERIFLEELLMQGHFRHKITEKIQVPEIREEILQICHTNGEIQVEKMEVVPEGILVEGILHIGFLYVKANDQIPFDVWSGMIPFQYLVECENVELDTQYDISCGIEQLSIELAGNGEVEVKAHLAFQSFLRSPLYIETISDIVYKERKENGREKRPGMIGYLVKKEDNLWELAKKYGTTEESIMEINDLSSKILKEGEKLLILKENMSIL